MIEVYFPTFLAVARWLVRIAPQVGLGALVLLVLLAIPWTYFNIKWGRELEAELADLKEQGAPVTIMDAVPEPVPDEQNAAVVYEELFQVRHVWAEPAHKPTNTPKSPLSELTKRLTYDDGIFALDAHAREVLRSREAQDILEKLRHGSERPYFVFPVNWEDGLGALFPHLAQCRSGCRLITAYARLLAAEGRVDEAFDWFTVALRMSEQAASEPTIIGQLVAWAFQAVTFKAMREVVCGVRISPAAAREFEDCLRHIDLNAPFSAAMAAERAMVCDVYELLRREPKEACLLLEIEFGLPARLYFGWPGRPFHKLDQLICLEYMQRYLELVRQPYRSAAAGLDALEKDLDEHFGRGRLPTKGYVASKVTPVYSRAPQKRDFALAQIDLCRVVMALKAYKYTHQAYPATLRQLQATLDYRLPEDPFSGKGFMYKPQGEGFKLYSLGVDLDDDGGATLEDEGHDYDNCDIVWECTT